MLRLFTALSGIASVSIAFLPLPAAAQPPDLPSRAEAEAVCRYVAGDHWSFRGFALGGGVFDVNNDGVPERVGSRDMGTAHVTIREITSRDGESLETNSVGFEWKTYGAYDGAWLPYDGRTYYIGARDINGRYRLYLSYVAPNNEEHVLCEFATHVADHLYQKRREDAAFCQSIAGEEPSFMPVEEYETAIRVEGRSETSLGGRIAVDFDNDGEVEELSRLKHESGAGRGCASEYYDVMDAVGALTAVPEEQALLMRLQGVDLSARHPGPICEGNHARWFQHEGRVYLENRYQGEQPRSPWSEFHQVSTVENGEARLVCESFFSVRTEIARYNDALWEKQPQ